MPSGYLCNMEQLIQQIEEYRHEIEQLQVQDPKALEDYRIRFLGSKGIVKNLFGELKRRIATDLALEQPRVDAGVASRLVPTIRNTAPRNINTIRALPAGQGVLPCALRRPILREREPSSLR